MIRPVPTNREIPFPKNGVIVSKTDPKGVITYCNELFLEMSGYSEEELLGQPHSILRHPLMPKAVFKLLWDTIQKKEEINAYVVNLTKNGDFYWVFGNVTPSFDAKNNIIGYFSVRRKPDPDKLAVIKNVYSQMLSLEKSQGIDASLQFLQNILNEKGVTYEEFILTF